MWKEDKMSEIRIIEKPDWISYEDIHELLYIAHESNRKKGFTVNTALMTGNEIEKHIGDQGKCFVALDGDKLVGTSSYRIIQQNYWCCKCEVVDRILVGVLPEYKGKHISALLFQKIEEEAKEKGYAYIENRTSEENEIMQRLCIKDGYRYIDFLSTKADHYTVVMLKWLYECPYKDWYIKLHFNIRRILIKVRFKPGRKKRFFL